MISKYFSNMVQQNHSSIRNCRKIVGAVAYHQKESKYPNSVDGNICKRLLIQHILKIYYCYSINIVQKLCLWEKDQKSMHKTNGICPPRNIFVNNERDDHDLTCKMVNKDCFLTDSLSSIDNIFNHRVAKIKYACYNQQKSSDIICEKWFVLLRMQEAIDTSDSRWDDQEAVVVNPKLIDEEVETHPIDLHCEIIIMKNAIKIDQKHYLMLLRLFT